MIGEIKFLPNVPTVYFLAIAEYQDQTIVLGLKREGATAVTPEGTVLAWTGWYLPTAEQHWELLPIFDLLKTESFNKLVTSQTISNELVECLLDNPLVRQMAMQYLSQHQH